MKWENEVVVFAVVFIPFTNPNIRQEKILFISIVFRAELVSVHQKIQGHDTAVVDVM